MREVQVGLAMILLAALLVLLVVALLVPLGISATVVLNPAECYSSGGVWSKGICIRAAVS